MWLRLVLVYSDSRPAFPERGGAWAIRAFKLNISELGGQPIDARQDALKANGMAPGGAHPPSGWTSHERSGPIYVASKGRLLRSSALRGDFLSILATVIGPHTKSCSRLSAWLR